MQDEKEIREATAELRANIINQSLNLIGSFEPESNFQAAALTGITAILPTVQQNACLLEEVLEKLEEIEKRLEE